MLKIDGQLYFDNSQASVTDKITRLANRYQTRFGQRPTICYVNKADLNGEGDEIEGVKIQIAPDVLRHHFWVGVENETVVAEAR